jgi:hypothetical protein
MSLKDMLLLSLSVVLLIIGIHQTMTIGFGQAYWAVMLSIALFLFFMYRKRR